METFRQAVRRFFEGIDFSSLPSWQRIYASMDPIAWTLFGLLLAALVLGLAIQFASRYAFLQPDEVEVTPALLLGRLKQNPTYLPPPIIVNRLGAEVTLAFLEYGDDVTTKKWRYQWSGVREELLQILSTQNAFGPIHALARYYKSEDLSEPATVRIRRTVLIHKLGQRRFLEPNADGIPAQLRVIAVAEEQQGELGFRGPCRWYVVGEQPPAVEGPVVEMEPIAFRSLDDAAVKLHIRRTPLVGGGFHLRLKRRAKMWVVVDEEMEWVS